MLLTQPVKQDYQLLLKILQKIKTAVVMQAYITMPIVKIYSYGIMMKITMVQMSN